MAIPSPAHLLRLVEVGAYLEIDCTALPGNLARDLALAARGRSGILFFNAEYLDDTLRTDLAQIGQVTFRFGGSSQALAS